MLPRPENGKARVGRNRGVFDIAAITILGHNVAMGRQHTSRRVVIVAYEDVQSLDVSGPLEVFAMANRFCEGAYRIDIVAPGDGTFTSSSGLTMQVTTSMSSVRRPVDTVIVVGGTGTLDAMNNDRLLRFLRRIAPQARRVASVCSGSFILAAAGLLEGRRATTHWSECATLGAMFPSVIVESDPIFVRDGNVVTSAGVTAGIDLALSLVEEDCGREVALSVARWLVMFVRRPGGQSQFSAQMQEQTRSGAERCELRDLRAFIAEHPDADLSIAQLARRAAMSERNFARVFKADFGATPAEYVERVRVETARRLLEDTSLALDDVARASGFGSAETLRRAFHRGLHVAPSDYRDRFRRAS